MKYKCKSDVFVTELGDTLALLDMENGTYYTLNQTGAFIWKKLSDGLSVENTVDALVYEYDVLNENAFNDVNTLVVDLELKGLVALDDTAARD